MGFSNLRKNFLSLVFALFLILFLRSWSVDIEFCSFEIVFDLPSLSVFDLPRLSGLGTGAPGRVDLRSKQTK